MGERMREINGPYKAEQWEGQNEFVVTGPGWYRLAGTYRKWEAEFAAEVGNIAHAEGVKAGRASRDGLRKALDTISLWPFDIMGDCVKDARHIAKKALEADGEGK